MYNRTTAQAQNEVRRLGKENIHKIRAVLTKYYGKKTDGDRLRLEEIVSQGYSNKNRTRMKEGDDLVLHIQGFEHILQELLDMIPEDQLSNYLYNKPLEQSKCLAKGLPQGFLKQLQVIKIVNTIGNGKSTSLSDSIGIGKFCNMKFPPYEDFKALLLALFESELALDDSTSKSYSTRGGRTPMFFSKTSTSINPTGKVSWGCWDCDGDHSRGSDECPPSRLNGFRTSPCTGESRKWQW